MNRIIPENSIVAELVAMLDEPLQEDFEERAAILEFEAGLVRGHAECLALLEVLRRNFSLTKPA